MNNTLIVTYISIAMVATEVDIASYIGIAIYAVIVICKPLHVILATVS